MSLEVYHHHFLCVISCGTLDDPHGQTFYHIGDIDVCDPLVCELFRVSSLRPSLGSSWNRMNRGTACFHHYVSTVCGLQVHWRR